MIKFLVGSALLLLFLVENSRAVTGFGFDRDEEKWYFWGDGIGAFDGQQGNKKPGSLWLSTDFGETQTVNYQWSGLAPGNYKITAYVRADRVQSGNKNPSFWHFYDGGEGSKNVFTDLHGSFEWRKVEYTLKVTKGALSVWFRLKTPGQVWVDDFSIEKTTAAESKVAISPATALRSTEDELNPVRQNKLRTVLLDFEVPARSGAFEKIVHKKGSGKLAKFKSQTYINLDPGGFHKGNWSAYDRLELVVHNDTDQFYPFYLVLGDSASVDYWSQLNHKTVLAPGINRLSFDLRQFVGERGSHRHRRSLKLSDLKKMFLVVDPDQKLPISEKFYLDDLALLAEPPPVVPRGVYAYDFTSQKAQGSTNFTRVTTQDIYDSSVGHGFIDPQFWRVEDSVYAGENLRYSIGILSGKFRIKLPNGKYRFSLIMDKLGMWDPPFWRARSVSVNGKPYLIESRNSAQEYLNDLLRFEDVVPGERAHPYDLYLSDIFSPVEKQVNVNNGFMEFEFSGDPSGISLNTLVIWKNSDNRRARRFLSEIKKRNRKEFDWISRKISFPKFASGVRWPSLVDFNLALTPSDQRPEAASEIKFQGGAGERHLQLLQVPFASDVRFSLSTLHSEDGKKYPPSELQISELVYQYASPDLNHETYMVTGKYLRPLSGMRVSYSERVTRFFSFSANIPGSLSVGTYKGKLTVRNKKYRKTFPIEIKVMPYHLPTVDFPVGFFGLDPIPYNYFESADMPALRQKYRYKALELIAERGFSTFTGLPPVAVDRNVGDLALDARELDQLFLKASELGIKGPVFSYGGQFPQQLLEEELMPFSMTSEVYHAQLSELLKVLMKKPHWPEIIHTFSDEAGGYSDRLVEDLSKAQVFKKTYPFIALGGFSSMKNKKAQKLNSILDFGIYSELTKEGTKLNKRWGSYNASPGNLDDPRFTFGQGLFLAREKGLSAYLEWHLVGFNNYPYYDLDGREADVSMLMPSRSGEVYPTLRFELATLGLQNFRKLSLLKELVAKKEGPYQYIEEASIWLSKLVEENYVLEKDHFLRGEGVNVSKFSAELDQHLFRITGAP